MSLVGTDISGRCSSSRFHKVNEFILLVVRPERESKRVSR